MPTRGAASAWLHRDDEIALADYGILRDLGPSSKDVELTLNVEGIKHKSPSEDGGAAG